VGRSAAEDSEGIFEQASSTSVYGALIDLLELVVRGQDLDLVE
jgi:hypothetical protein